MFVKTIGLTELPLDAVSFDGRFEVSFGNSERNLVCRVVGMFKEFNPQRAFFEHTSILEDGFDQFPAFEPFSL